MCLLFPRVTPGGVVEISGFVLPMPSPQLVMDSSFPSPKQTKFGERPSSLLTLSAVCLPVSVRIKATEGKVCCHLIAPTCTDVLARPSCPHSVCTCHQSRVTIATACGGFARAATYACSCLCLLRSVLSSSSSARVRFFGLLVAFLVAFVV